MTMLLAWYLIEVIKPINYDKDKDMPVLVMFESDSDVYQCSICWQLPSHPHDKVLVWHNDETYHLALWWLRLLFDKKNTLIIHHYP